MLACCVCASFTRIMHAYAGTSGNGRGGRGGVLCACEMGGRLARLGRVEGKGSGGVWCGGVEG